MYRVGRKLARQVFSVPEHYARSWCPTSRRYFISTALAHEDFVMKLPSMGDSITEGTMVEWLKAVGDHAEEDEVIAIVETDKVSVDIRAPSAGTITNIMADVDAVVEVGQDLVSFSTAPGSPLAAKDTDQKSESKSETASVASKGMPEVVKQTVGRIPLIKFRHGDPNPPRRNPYVRIHLNVLSKPGSSASMTTNKPSIPSLNPNTDTKKGIMSVLNTARVSDNAKTQ